MEDIAKSDGTYSGGNKRHKESEDWGSIIAIVAEAVMNIHSTVLGTDHVSTASTCMDFRTHLFGVSPETKKIFTPLRWWGGHGGIGDKCSGNPDWLEFA